MVAYALWWLITIYVWVLLARVILSFFPLVVPGWTPRGIVLVLVEGIYTLTDPPIRGLRKVLPPLKLGTVALDFSVLFVLIGLQILQSLLRFLPF